jgi:hypothetical protein
VRFVPLESSILAPERFSQTHSRFHFSRPAEIQHSQRSLYFGPCSERLMRLGKVPKMLPMTNLMRRSTGS